MITLGSNPVRVTIAGPDLVDITSSGSPEPGAGSRLLFIDGGFVKCAT